MGCNIGTVSLLLLLTSAAAAQSAFTGLATNANGSRLWFSSRLRLRNSESFSHSKAYTWDALAASPTAAIQLFEQRPAALSFPPSGVLSSTYHEILDVSASADGATVAINAANDCINFTLCTVAADRFRTTITRSGTIPREESEYATLSSSGQFAVLQSSGTFPRARILNLVTGAATPPFDGRAAGYTASPRRIANDGTVVQADELRLWPSGERRSLPVDGCFAINAGATRAFCMDFPRLNRVDLASNTVGTVFTAQGDRPIQVDLSDSGDQLAVLDTAGLWLVRSDGTGLRRLVAPESQLTGFVLSRDGNVIFAASADNRILRIDTATGTTSEIVPATPAVFLPLTTFAELVRGTVYEYRSPAIPSISEVRIPGTTVAVFHAGPELVSFHVPFDAPITTGWPELVFAAQPVSPFTASVFPGPVSIVNFSPFWYTQGGPPNSPFYPMAALHQDFRGPVTAADPARAGEIIHAYGGGFGPVEPAPPPGTPAPEAPLARIRQQPFECTMANGNSSESAPAETLYAGLAPSWIGLYQLDIRVPQVPAPANPDRFPVIRCGIPNSTSAVGYLPFRTN